MTLSKQIFQWLGRRREASNPGVKICDIAVLLGTDKAETHKACTDLEAAGLINIVKYPGSRVLYAVLPNEPGNSNVLSIDEAAGASHAVV